MTQDNSKRGFEKLNNHNYATWKRDMAGYLRETGGWRITMGTARVPDPSSEPVEYEKYLDSVDKAAGKIYNSIEHGLRADVTGIEGDPVEMWKKLESIHSSKKPGMRFASYDSLFSIRLRPNESLPDLITRVGSAIAALKERRPDKFTINDLDDELHSMTLIRALPSEYTLLKDLLMILDSLVPATISEAFRNRAKNNEERAENDNVAPAMAMAAKSNRSV